MRAAIIGVVVSDPGLRWAVVDGVSQVSHTHPLAVEGARYLAEAAALLAADDERVDTVLRKALRAVQNPALATAIGAAPPRWSWAGAMARNLALYPVILAHGFCRLLPRRRR
jgi:ADP-ribosylglycohydrolase